MIQDARNRTVSSVNNVLIDLYWDAGEYVSEKVNDEKWGEKTVQKLADYIKLIFPEFKVLIEEDSTG